MLVIVCVGLIVFRNKNWQKFVTLNLFDRKFSVH